MIVSWNRNVSCGTYPIMPRHVLRSASRMDRSSIQTSPLWGRSNPMIRSATVVLPTPEAPTIAMNFPAGSTIET